MYALTHVETDGLMQEQVASNVTRNVRPAVAQAQTVSHAKLEGLRILHHAHLVPRHVQDALQPLRHVQAALAHYI
jgi:hypothetical protein